MCPRAARPISSLHCKGFGSFADQSAQQPYLAAFQFINGTDHLEPSVGRGFFDLRLRMPVSGMPGGDAGVRNVCRAESVPDTWNPHLESNHLESKRERTKLP